MEIRVSAKNDNVVPLLKQQRKEFEMAFLLMKRKQAALIDKVSVRTAEDPYTVIIDIRFVQFFDNSMLYKGFYLFAKRQIVKDLSTVGIKKKDIKIEVVK